jgi:oligopeptide/dipeptide ABC transporter ATP-binding protein
VSALLEVCNLVKHFPLAGGWFGKGEKVVRAVDDVSFTVGAGETLALVGESGCGKSTTGRCVLRLVQPTSGAIRFGGQDIFATPNRELRRLRQRMQIIFQDPFSSLNPRMTVGQAIAEPLIVHRALSRSEVHNRVAELLEMVDLEAEYAHRYPHEFSGGQRQRIVIARALALHPQLIVADEPTSALDVSVQAQIVQLMQALQQRLGVSYLFISHNLAVVRQMAHRTAVMYLGRIVEIGPTKQLFAQPRHPYTQALLSAVPIPDPTRERQRILLAGDVPSPINVPSGCRFHPRCPYVMEECKEKEPQLLVCDGGQAAACYLVKREA